LILEGIASDRRNLFWTIAHIGLGFVCTLTPFALIVWFYFIFVTNFFKAIRLLQEKKPAFFFFLFSYLISFELLDRMAITSPFIPYEVGKYFLVLSGIIGLLAVGIRNPKGILMALLVTPAVFYDFSNQRTNFDIVNNYLAPVSVGLGLAYSNRLIITSTQLNQILKLIWWACLSSLFFTYIKTPDFETISFTLKAQFETTAGHSSNQVSTILGLGMFLSFYSVFKRLNFSGNRIFDFLIFFGFAFQGLISFSRGGMMVGAIGILILLFLRNPDKLTNNKVQVGKPLFYIIITLLSLYGVFEVANRMTGGNLLLRYQGETAGTMAGSKEVTVDHFVTGRLSIFEQDIDLWIENFITGVGVGSSRFLRNVERVGVSPHVELSRLLAEQGLLGLFYAFYFFCFIPLQVYQSNERNIQRTVLMAIITIAILTTFHAAMRTFVTPLFMILGSLKITSDWKPSKPTHNI
jgi:O-antigen ligase